MSLAKPSYKNEDVSSSLVGSTLDDLTLDSLGHSDRIVEVSEDGGVQDRDNSIVFPRLDSQYYEGDKIRLLRVRSALKGKRLDVKEVREIYRRWVAYDEGFVIQEQNDLSSEKRTIGVKYAKRGNDVYRWRIKERFREIEGLADNENIEFFNKEEITPRSPCLFITFTYDVKLKSLAEAWRDIGKEYNRAMSWLRRRYGSLSAFRAFESFENGYPHIHAVVIFDSAKFDVFQDKAGEYRIQQKNEIEGSWHSFIDVSAVQNLGLSLRYLTKYLRKVNNREETKHETTLAMMWLHRKRAYGMSGQLLQRLKTYRLDSLLHNSNKNRLIQHDLEGLPLPKRSKWVFVGLCSWFEIVKEALDASKSNLWTYDLKRVPFCLSK